MSDQPTKRNRLVFHLLFRLGFEIEVTVTVAALSADEEPTADGQIPSYFTGALLRQRREAAGLTRDALGALANLAPSTIRNIETGRHKPTAAIVRRLCAVAALRLKSPPRKSEDS